jgi:CDP-diacylglycerol--serine O-phosphatidyltransferase
MRGAEVFMLISMGLVSFLMVSNIRYPSFKKMDLKKANAIKVLVVLIIVFSMLYVYPIESTTLLITAYLLYGIVRTFYTIAKQKKT